MKFCILFFTCIVALNAEKVKTRQHPSYDMNPSYGGYPKKHGHYKPHGYHQPHGHNHPHNYNQPHDYNQSHGYDHQYDYNQKYTSQHYDHNKPHEKKNPKANINVNTNIVSGGAPPSSSRSVADALSIASITSILSPLGILTREDDRRWTKEAYTVNDTEQVGIRGYNGSSVVYKNRHVRVPNIDLGNITANSDANVNVNVNVVSAHSAPEYGGHRYKQHTYRKNYTRQIPTNAESPEGTRVATAYDFVENTKEVKVDPTKDSSPVQTFQKDSSPIERRIKFL